MENKLIREHLNAVKIIECKNCENSELLLKTKYNQDVISKVAGCKVKKGGYILLDFGKELHGGINLTVNHVKDDLNGLVRIVFGESVAKLCNYVERTSVALA